MRQLTQTCRDAVVLGAIHDNYIDYYPDAAGFSYEKTVAFSADGAPVRAWLNEGRGAQSYRYRSDCAEPPLKDNLRQIREGLAPTAYFIDVWSSIRPYDYWTADGKYFSAVYSRDTWGNLFAWIRDFLGDRAPQVSESGTDVLIGWLDGAQTNHLRVSAPVPGGESWTVWDWKCSDSERVPWFDAAHHDRFVLHGAGYESRYLGGLDPRLHGIYSDDYITTEILTGHPAMVPRPFDRQVVRKYWLTRDAMRGLAQQTITNVEFVDSDMHRQHVTWSGDAHVWVNRGTQDWTVDGTVLPPYGFLARVPLANGVIVAAIERRDGVIVESSRSPGQYYVNARGQMDDNLPVSLSVEQVSWQPIGNQPDPYLERQNPDRRAIAFPEVTTSAACRLTWDGKAIFVTPLPDTREPFDVAVSLKQLPWHGGSPRRVAALDMDGKVLDTKPVDMQDGIVKLRCTPGVFQYRLEP